MQFGHVPTFGLDLQGLKQFADSMSVTLAKYVGDEKARSEMHFFTQIKEVLRDALHVKPPPPKGPSERKPNLGLKTTLSELKPTFALRRKPSELKPKVDLLAKLRSSSPR